MFDLVDRQSSLPFLPQFDRRRIHNAGRNLSTVGLVNIPASVPSLNWESREDEGCARIAEEAPGTSEPGALNCLKQAHGPQVVLATQILL
jgi:hypothetical protein